MQCSVTESASRKISYMYSLTETEGTLILSSSMAGSTPLRLKVLMNLQEFDVAKLKCVSAI